MWVFIQCGREFHDSDVKLTADNKLAVLLGPQNFNFDVVPCQEMPVAKCHDTTE